MKYDFGGWATRNDLQCADGRVIKKDAFNKSNGSSWSRNTKTFRRSFRRSMPTQKSSGRSITTSTRFSMSRNARTPRCGRKSRKWNAKEGIAY